MKIDIVRKWIKIRLVLTVSVAGGMGTNRNHLEKSTRKDDIFEICYTLETDNASNDTCATTRERN